MRLTRFLPVAALAMIGCSNPFGCDEDRQVVEVVPSSPFYEIQVELLEGLRAGGHTCRSDGSVQTTSGIGTRYVCTRC